jgi:hypothetical protein
MRLSALEDDGLVSVEQGAILEMEADRFGKDAAFDVAALADEVVRGVGVGDRFHVLMNDRAFIEVGT